MKHDEGKLDGSTVFQPAPPSYGRCAAFGRDNPFPGESDLGLRLAIGLTVMLFGDMVAKRTREERQTEEEETINGSD